MWNIFEYMTTIYGYIEEVSCEKKVYYVDFFRNINFCYVRACVCGHDAKT